MGIEIRTILQAHSIPPPPCGAEIPDGWAPLVERLIVDLIDLGWDRDCQQIKEKFGGLRFYIGSGDAAVPEYKHDLIAARIADAEEEALRTCMVCECPGKRHPPRTYVLCDLHASSRG